MQHAPLWHGSTRLSCNSSCSPPPACGVLPRSPPNEATFMMLQTPTPGFALWKHPIPVLKPGLFCLQLLAGPELGCGNAAWCRLVRASSNQPTPVNSVLSSALCRERASAIAPFVQGSGLYPTGYLMIFVLRLRTACRPLTRALDVPADCLTAPTSDLEPAHGSWYDVGPLAADPHRHQLVVRPAPARCIRHAVLAGR